MGEGRDGAGRVEDAARSLASGLARAAADELAGRFEGAVALTSFRESVADTLTADERLTIVDQAQVLLEGNYVHLPLKAAMHAVDPVQRLRLLRARLTNPVDDEELTDRGFHAEMSSIFHSVRDLHTNYLLPEPYGSKVAFLPFMVEEFWEDGARRHLVSHVADGFEELTRGDVITHWNGSTIGRAIAANADRFAGSNDAARHARGVESLTVRPLVIHLPPEADWVDLVVESGDGTTRELRIPWLVADNLPAMTADGPQVTDTETAMGIDLDGDATSRAHKLLFAQQPAARELRGLASAPRRDADEVVTQMPGFFRARRVSTTSGRFGHLRIFTFNTDDPWGFVLEFVRLAEELGTDGLIVDVRGNGGGHIWAAELLLQTLTPHPITPEPVQFIGTQVNLELCRQHAFGEGGIDLGPWLGSLEESLRTGAVFSRAFPITPTDAANALGQQVHRPAVLVTDARCYSATDIFAAGFQDHGVGPVIGVDPNTGAGGANVWTHDLLRALYTDVEATPYGSLPAGVGMRVSIRRTLRVGPAAGTPVEDLGVAPDVRHDVTRRDLTDENADLLDLAGELLAARPVRRLDAAGGVDNTGGLVLSLDVAGLDRVDAYVDDRPRATIDLGAGVDGNGAPTLVVPGALGATELRLEGFDRGELAAARSFVFVPAHDGDGTAVVDTVAHHQRVGSAAVPEAVRFLVHAPGASPDDVRAAVDAAWDTGASTDEVAVRHLFAMDGEIPAPPLDEHFAVHRRPPGTSPASRRRAAFELARRLMATTGWEVQPDLGTTVFGRELVEDTDDLRRAGGGATTPLPGTEDPAWALESLRVPLASKTFDVNGAGVVVGHPDTGYTKHAELLGALDLTRDRDVLDDDDNALDPLKKGFFGLLGNPGHGTSTGSVIVSRNPAIVTGTAPGSTLVPIRAITTVALVFDGDVARAVEYARASGCHVISMSLGGIGFSSSLRTAIRAAIGDGLLVLAAAGNEVGFVVAPASYSEVIAVAATNIADESWSGSSHGTAVDISAPGESVHAAKARKDEHTRTSRSSGTSYAVAQTAGVAALWLEHHGRDALIARYGAPNLQGVFRHLLTTTSRVPANWDASEYGAGIVDAHALLAAPLPDTAVPVGGPRAAADATSRMADALPGVDGAGMEAAVERLLADVPEDERHLYLGELTYLLAEDPLLRAGVTALADGRRSVGRTATAATAARLRTEASRSLADATIQPGRA
ncbi:MAG: S8 family serine peptidase [Actinomycetota bacterium]|nr:S8 family serine peptidase [Actinomycetota bacterium]